MRGLGLSVLQNRNGRWSETRRRVRREKQASRNNSSSSRGWKFPTSDWCLRELCSGLRSFAELKNAAGNLISILENKVGSRRLGQSGLRPSPASRGLRPIVEAVDDFRAGYGGGSPSSGGTDAAGSSTPISNGVGIPGPRAGLCSPD